MRLWVDKIASASRNVPLRREVRVDSTICAEEGYVVAARVHGEKTVYNQLEDVHGRMVTLHDGDVIVGVLGHRNALHGYSGYVPETIKAGERLGQPELLLWAEARARSLVAFTHRDVLDDQVIPDCSRRHDRRGAIVRAGKHE